MGKVEGGRFGILGLLGCFIFDVQSSFVGYFMLREDGAVCCWWASLWRCCLGFEATPVCWVLCSCFELLDGVFLEFGCPLGCWAGGDWAFVIEVPGVSMDLSVLWFPLVGFGVLGAGLWCLGVRCSILSTIWCLGIVWWIVWVLCLRGLF